MADQDNSLANTKVEDLEVALAKETDLAAVRAAQKADTRVTAQPLYEARIAALAPAPKPAAPSGTKREAATRVKYNGKWYEPGAEISFAAAADAAPYDESKSLVELAKK